MNASADMSIISLLTHASVVVQVVLAILILLSLTSWTRIFQKFFQLRKAKQNTEEFEGRFWGGVELTQLYENSQTRREGGAQERIFSAGMAEFMKLNDRDRSEALDGTRRAMRAAYQREMDQLERGLQGLASIGSVSPYIGLFGTVWGIMNAFTGLSALDNANLAMVAPGIAEALVATAIGLFAAIPAVAAYNRFANEVERLSNRFESFSEEFLNILQRQRG